MALRKLSETRGFKVADDSADIRGWRVLDVTGAPAGTVEELLFDPDENLVHYAVIALANGRRVLVPARRLDLQEQAHRVRFDGAAADWGSLQDYRDDLDFHALEAETRMPWHVRLLEERLRLGKRREQIGEVSITKKPVTETVDQALELMDEDVEVTRRLVDRPATGDERPVWEGDTLRVPVIGEKLVVEKRPYVIEEVLITKRKKPHTEHIHETLTREEVEVQQRPVSQEFQAAEPSAAEQRERSERAAPPAGPVGPTLIVPERDPDEH